MRNVTRAKLPTPSRKYFTAKTKLIRAEVGSVAKRAEAKRLWKQAHGTAAMLAAVETLVRMNAGLPWCMYCEADTATVIKKGLRHAIVDHWEPIKEAPQRAFVWKNHFLACQRCNSFFKHTEFPREPGGAPLLLNLVDDSIDAHFEYEPSNGKLVAKNGSAKGGKTIEFFQLIDFDGSRYGVWAAAIAHLREYDRAVTAGDQARADMIKHFVVELRHRSVVARLLSIAGGPHGAALTAPDVPALVTTHQVATWL